MVRCVQDRLALLAGPTAGLAAVVAVLVTSGCPRPPARAPEAAAVAKDTALLVLPLTEAARVDAEAALGRLSDRAVAGNRAAAWSRLHYLMDLFDDARFRRDAASLELLHHTLGRPDPMPARGPEATDWVLAELLREVDELLGGDRMHPHAQAARTLLEFDSRPPISRVGLLTRMAELKAVAKRDHPLADNARLRLAGYCRNALADIPNTRYADRHLLLAHCLYPLYPSDPEPYFARRAEARPPTPGWRDIVARLQTLVGTVADGSRRLAGAGAAVRADVEQLTATRAAAMPVAPTPDGLGVPRVERATPYDWTPLILLGAGANLDKLDERDALGKQITGDGRRTATVALTGAAPATALIAAAEAVAAAGAESLGLAVGMRQHLDVPRGDYWFERIRGGSIDRLGVIRVSLVPLRGAGAIDSRTWDASRATLGLHLYLTDREWTLTSPTGVVAVVPSQSTEHAAETLRGVLGWLAAAFTDEDAVVVVPGPGATVADIVAAVQAVRHDAQGRLLIAQVGLGENAPTTTENTLAGRIERRSKATVEIRPSALAVRGSVVRACYQQALDGNPGARGEFRLELSGDVVNVTAGPAEPALRECLMAGLAPMMKTRKMASAEVVFTAE